MIGIVGGGLSAAKLVEGYREAGGTDAITIWSHGPATGPYHRPPLSKRLLRGEAEARRRARCIPAEWYAERDGRPAHGAAGRGRLDEFDADTIVIATGRTAAARSRVPWRSARSTIRSSCGGAPGEARTAVVVGGGFIGLEGDGRPLTQLGVQVTQIVREPLVFAALQAPALSEAAARALFARARRRPASGRRSCPGRAPTSSSRAWAWSPTSSSGARQGSRCAAESS